MMNEANKTIIRTLVMLCCLFIFYLAVVFVSATVQLAEAADRLYLGLGQPIFIIILAIFSILVLSPVYLYFKLPKALVPPKESSGPKHQKYLDQLRQRLNTNPLMSGQTIKSNDEIPTALAVLKIEAEKIMRETAAAVFLGTAIMQNGRLDGLITLVTQSKMVWRIACIYQQRPSPRQMIFLYTNVAAAALLAESIDDIDISEITAPILSSILVSGIPGASLMVNCVANGAANAFLTLRIGAIAVQYCEATSTPNRSIVRRNATLGAAAMVGGIVKENSARILNGSWKLITKGVTGTIDSTVKGVKTAAGKVTDSLVGGTKTISRKITGNHKLTDK